MLITLVACGKKDIKKNSDKIFVSNATKTFESFLFNTYLDRNFDTLPLKGQIKDQALLWPGDYWPFNKGSINKRWNSPGHPGFDTDSPSKEKVKALSLEELSALSPSEKFDLLRGDYQYTLKREVEILANPSAEDWEGMCQGWAMATINHHEPTPKNLMNPDGIQIPFGSSDIKALLSYYYAFGVTPETEQVGLRCDSTSYQDANCLDDLSPATFHLLLTNKLGRDGTSFIADIAPLQQVWNHPVYSYESEIIYKNKKFVHLKTKVIYIDEADNNYWIPILGSPHQFITKRQYEYILDLSEEGKILEGKWISSERPDFIWYTRKISEFEGPFNLLTSLL